MSDVEAREYFKTGIPGLDSLFKEGIPKNSSILVAGGAGSGKTILCLQILKNAAKDGKKALYMSFEESKEKLKNHMKNFGWNPDKLEKENKLYIERYSPFEVSRIIEAMLEKL